MSVISPTNILYTHIGVLSLIRTTLRSEFAHLFKMMLLKASLANWEIESMAISDNLWIWIRFADRFIPCDNIAPNLRDFAALIGEFNSLFWTTRPNSIGAATVIRYHLTPSVYCEWSLCDFLSKGLWKLATFGRSTHKFHPKQLKRLSQQKPWAM